MRPGRISGEPATCNFVVLLVYMWGDHYMEWHNNGPGGIRTHDHLRFLCHGMQGRYSTGLNHRPSTLSFADDILIFYFKLPTNTRSLSFYNRTNEFGWWLWDWMYLHEFFGCCSPAKTHVCPVSMLPLPYSNNPNPKERMPKPLLFEI